MKNILVATDFSPNAYLAAVYAAQFACHTGARIVLLHVFHMTTALQEMKVVWDENFAPECQAQAKLDALAHELHTTYGVSITRLLKPGFAADEIMELAERVKADIVVTGAYSKPGIVSGKTTAAILAKACIPVLCVPADAVLNPLSGVAFFQEEDTQTASKAKLLKLFNPEITILYWENGNAVPATLMPPANSTTSFDAEQTA